MQRIILFTALILSTIIGYSQEFKNIYDPAADAKKDVKIAIDKAKLENKHVFVMIGFNKCIWCQWFHKLIHEDSQIDSLIKADYITVMVNYDKENRNTELMKELEFPNRFGFPVFVILNQDGRRIHTQNSAYLEEGKGYNRKEVLAFFRNWNKTAVNPKTYENK